MILNEKTQKEFGYTFETGKNLCKIYCQCDYCGIILLKKKTCIKAGRKTIEKDCCKNKDCIKQKSRETNLKKYNVDHPTKLLEVQIKMKASMLKNFGVEYPSQSPIVMNKMQNTNKVRYGVDNPLKNKIIRNKIKSTNLENFGVEYPSQSPIVMDKIRNTNKIRYGVENPFQNEDIKLKIKQKNLILYGSECALNNEEIKQRMVNTNKIRYGVENPFQNEDIKLKIKQKNLENFGVEYPLQSPVIKTKMKLKNLDKYGVEYPAQLESTKNKMLNTKLERYGTLNVNFGKLENEIKEWLNSFSFNFKSDVTILEGKEIDLLDNNIGIEYCGLFWHTELSLQPRLKNYHYDKYKKCLEKNIQLITIFEDEWKYRQNQCKNFLKSVLNKLDQRIYARKTKIQEIKKEVANEFYELYHIQGKCNLKIAYGLYYNEELVGVMSLGSHHRKSKELVLNRLCFKDDVQILGGASKLFNKCIAWAKENNYSKIISWSDNRWSLGKVYEKLGFKLEEELSPDYSYVYLHKPTIRFSKQSFKKSNKGIPKEQTEIEWASENGYARIWDCGKKRWVFII